MFYFVTPTRPRILVVHPSFPTTSHGVEISQKLFRISISEGRRLNASDLELFLPSLCGSACTRLNSLGRGGTGFISSNFPCLSDLWRVSSVFSLGSSFPLFYFLRINLFCIVLSRLFFRFCVKSCIRTPASLSCSFGMKHFIILNKIMLDYIHALFLPGYVILL